MKRFSSKPKSAPKKTAAKAVASKEKKVAGPSPIPTKAPGEFPMRINKYLAWKGFATRRDADTLIERNQVTINGRFAVLGDKIEATDAVEVRRGHKPESFMYYAFNKPRGIASETNRKTPSVKQTFPVRGVFPVGGLDANAEGLLLLTNDRRIIDRLMNPNHAHVKEYTIETIGPLRSNFKEKMESGVTIGNSEPIQCSVHIMRDNLFSLRIVNHDNHIRQMCSMFFAEIASLKRTAIMNIRLGGLSPNGYRQIQGDELATFLKDLGLGV